MSDSEECDLDQLTALLEEDDNDEIKNPEDSESFNPPDNTEANNFSGIEKKTKDTNDEATFDQLTDLLGESDSEDEDDVAVNEECSSKTDIRDVGENSQEEKPDKIKIKADEMIDSNEKPLDGKLKKTEALKEDNIDPDETNKVVQHQSTENSDKSNSSEVSVKEKNSKTDADDERNEDETERREEMVEDSTVEGINGDNFEIADDLQKSSENAENCFDDEDDFDMEEAMKSMENQSVESIDSQNENQSSMDSEDNFPETSQESQADGKQDITLKLKVKKCREQSDEEMMEGVEAVHSYDSESSENIEEWLDEKECQNMEVKESDSETEAKPSGTLSKEQILVEMKLMSERMKQLEKMLATSESESKPSSTVTSKSDKTKSTVTTKAQIQKKPLQSDSRHSNKCSVNKTVTSVTAKQEDSKKFDKKALLNRQTIKKENSDVKNLSKPKCLEGSAKKDKYDKRKVLTSSTADKSGKEKKKIEDQVLEEEENPFFAATPTNEESTLLSTDPRSLFGDSDDSDWEGLDGEKKSNLSDEGREIKKLLSNGPKQRIAHKPTYDSSLLKKSPPQRWSAQSVVPRHKPEKKTKLVAIKPQLNPETGTVSGKYTLREEYKPKPVTPQLTNVEEKDVATDPYCGIKIINPRISMSDFKSKMSGRTMIMVSHIEQKVSKNNLQKDNWVTVGVVVHRTEPRQSAAGKSFSIWKLSDLKNCDKTISFFLFGNVFKEHWKNDLGTVIGLLNPTMMEKSEKSQSELAFTINHPQQLLIMGVSKDLGRCKGTTKAGNPCSHFINKSQGEFCTYHVQAAYKKSSAKRTELQASTGITPKAFGDKGRKSSKDSFWVYGGQTFTSMRPQAKSSKDQVTLKKLQHAEANKGAQKVTTMSLHELEPEDEVKFKKMEDKDAGLLEKLMVPTAGSMNLVKHLVKKDKPQLTDPSKPSQPQIESVSARDLLKQHQNELKQRMAERKRLAATPTLGRGFSVGQDISLDVPMKKSASRSAELAKSLAVAKLKEKGGVQKEDPNAVRKKLLSPEQKEKIRKRVAEDIEIETQEADPETSEPPKKKSKFLGSVDLNDPEVQKLLKSRSKHKGALAEAEAEHEEKYFMALEKKEKMEEKMDSVMEVEVKLFKCKQCQYTAYSLTERCKKENHNYIVRQGMKRFYKCKQCKKRMETFQKFPTKACQECGATNFERVSMLKERKGPKLESEELSIRGNEQKYLGSLNQKNFLNV